MKVSLEHLCSFFHLKFSSIITSLLTSLLLSLPEEGMPVISTLKKKPENLQVEKLKQQQADVLRLQNVPKSHFPNGIHDNMFVGTEDELGQKHQGFLKPGMLWLPRQRKSRKGKQHSRLFPSAHLAMLKVLSTKQGQ